MGLVNDIKERRITQIVVGYLVAGWIVMSVFDQFADRGVVPSVVYEVALTLFLFGIAISLILGWYHGEKGRQQFAPFEILQLGVVGLMALATSLYVVRADFQERTRQSLLGLESGVDLRSVAILYFEAANEDLVPVADGFTEALIRRLSTVRDLDVVSSNGVAQFRGQDLAPEDIAAALSAGTVVTGTVDQSGQDLRVNVRLLDGESGAELERTTASWPADDVITALEELPIEVARQFRSILGQEIDLRRGRTSTTTPAWLLSQRAAKLIKDADAAIGAQDLQGAVAAYQAADAELVQAIELDPNWPEPVLQRGWISYNLSQFTQNPAELRGYLETAADFADQAIALDPGSGAASELAGISRYRLWFMGTRVPGLIESPTDAQALFDRARTEMERALTIEGGLARTRATMSHLWYQVGDAGQAYLEAQRAYEEDAYLQAADQVLDRLFLVSYDQGRHADADRWCLEGFERFPSSYRFTQCQIWTLTMDAADPDVDRAWELLAELPPLIPETIRAQTVGVSQIAVAGVIGRAQLHDSASAVMARARAEGGADAEGELLSMEAAMRAVMGDTEEAIRLLQTYVISHPGHFSAERGLHWWWTDLRGDERFERIRQAN